MVSLVLLSASTLSTDSVSAVVPLLLLGICGACCFAVAVNANRAAACSPCVLQQSYDDSSLI